MHDIEHQCVQMKIVSPAHRHKPNKYMKVYFTMSAMYNICYNLEAVLLASSPPDVNSAEMVFTG